MAKISIIVPVYNVESYLSRCINSIISQSFSDFEIILVDDGSTDNSGQLCDNFSLKDNRIKVIHKTNGGLCSARNAGIKVAQSDFIGFVDSDDWICPDMFEHLYMLQQQTNADIVSCSYKLSYKYPDFINQKKFNIKIMSREEALENFLRTGISKNINDFPSWTKLYKKSLFENISFPDNLYFEDIPTNFLLIQNSIKYVYSSKICYYYFQNSTSITRNIYLRKHNDLLGISNLLNRYALNENDKIKKLVKQFEYKSYFSLLSKILKYGSSSDISKIEIKNNLLKPYRKNFYKVLKIKLPIKKKIASIIIFLFFEIMYAITNKLRRKE